MFIKNTNFNLKSLLESEKINKNNKRSLSVDFKEDNLMEDIIINKKNQEKLMNEEEKSTFCATKNTLYLNKEKINNKNENLILQNLKICDTLIKLIVIGDKNVGKTKFISKVLNLQNLNFKTYEPTSR